MTAPSQLHLTAGQQSMLSGECGAAAALSLRIISALGRAAGAARLRPIESAHVDGCLYHGQAGLDLARRLVETGGRVAVRTTLNVGSLDLLHPDLVRTTGPDRAAGRALMDAYVALGCEPTWTCAPYQITHRPALGSQVAWAESNAITFVNSVLGARTERYGDFADIAAAITGLVPDVGLHTDAGRRATFALDCRTVPARVWDSDIAWAALGCLLGERARGRVGAILGPPSDLADGGATEDRLKALAATAASAGGVALFHLVGVTPEAPDVSAATALQRDAVGEADLRAARERIAPAVGAGPVDAVCLGTPHFSLSEFAALAALLDGGEPFADGVEVYVSTSRAVLAAATDAGYVRVLESAGGRILTDTCSYVAPVLGPQAHTVMTNSGKWAWYAPMNLGVTPVLASLADCVASARAGEVAIGDRW